MVSAALKDGTAGRHSVFEVFARRLPTGRRYGVVAGLGRLMELIRDFRFTDEDIDFLRRSGVVDESAAAWLADYRFTGDIDGYAEGELFFPGSPILTVSGGFAECVVLETLILSVLNHDCAIAAGAARMVTAARGRPIIEMGSRRTHEQAAVAAARAAYLAGFASTSNLAAGGRYGIPTTGTSAHAFTLLHDDEPAAFASQVEALGKNTTLLVDTYGAGTAVVTGSGAPTAGLVYKLVEVDGRAVVKRSENKATVGGRKTAIRRHKPTGTATEEIIVSQGVPDHNTNDRLLQRSYVFGAEVAAQPSLAESRAHPRQCLSPIPWEGPMPFAPDPAIPV